MCSDEIHRWKRWDHSSTEARLPRNIDRSIDQFGLLCVLTVAALKSRRRSRGFFSSWSRLALAQTTLSRRFLARQSSVCTLARVWLVTRTHTYVHAHTYALRYHGHGPSWNRRLSPLTLIRHITVLAPGPRPNLFFLRGSKGRRRRNGLNDGDGSRNSRCRRTFDDRNARSRSFNISPPPPPPSDVIFFPVISRV